MKIGGYQAQLRTARHCLDKRQGRIGHPEAGRYRAVPDPFDEPGRRKSRGCARAEAESAGRHCSRSSRKAEKSKRWSAVTISTKASSTGRRRRCGRQDRHSSRSSTRLQSITDCGLDDTIVDSPVSFGGYSPGNYDGKYEGTISIRHAFAESRNVPADQDFSPNWACRI